MREKLKALAELQKVDLEIQSLKKSAEVHPKQVTELEKELAAARSAVEAERARLADVERQKRSLEQNIQDEKDKVKKWETRLAEQRSTREYAALAREIDIAKKANQTMAEELVELGKTLTAAREAAKVKEQEFAARQDQIGGKLSELKQKIDESQGQVQELEEKRGKVTGSVDGTLLRRYDTIRKKRMPALVSVIGGTCQGCNMNVPPQLYNTLRSTLGSDVCPSCHRIIYASEALEAPAQK
ncbi:MAG TPA: C4-type zinc ribbon domain-containing protein [Myxococcaceae bacterium]